MANCAVCRDDIEPGRACRRCGSPNKGLEDIKWRYFGSFWGVLSLLLVFPLLAAMLPGVFSRVDEILQPVASLRIGGPIALLITVIIAFYTFSLRNLIHQRTLKSRFKENPPKPIFFFALICFAIAILLTFLLGFGVTAKDSLVGPAGYTPSAQGTLLSQGSTLYLLFKLAMTGCLILVFAFLALSASMMAAFEYGVYASKHRPSPIYLNEQLLLKVALRSVRKHLQVDEHLSPAERLPKEGEGSVAAQDPGKAVSISEMKRLEGGGIALTLHHEGELTKKQGTNIREDRTWHVETDCWGHLSKAEEKNLRVIKVGEQVLPPLESVLSRVRTLVGTQAGLRLRELERQKDGGMLLRVSEQERVRSGGPREGQVSREWLVQIDSKGRVGEIREHGVHSTTQAEPGGQETQPAH